MYNKLTKKDRYIKDEYIFVDDNNINEMITKNNDNVFTRYEYYGFVSSLCNENQGEVRYIRELVSREIDCNFPSLICECDLDFSCRVAVVKVKFCEYCVKWEKIGLMSGKEKEKRNFRIFFEKYRNSGIRRVEDWSDDDWQKYGDIAYDLLQDDYFFHDWCAKNWQEELYRRCWGYYHRYFNDDKNIDWVNELDFKFESNKYQEFFCKV